MKKATPVQINWKPDKNNPVPLYQQIVDYIYQKISSGDWPVRTRLPSQRALAEQFDVNRSTITSALDELTAFGIIRSGHGAGTLVINNTWGLMLPEFQKWEKYVTSAVLWRTTKPSKQSTGWNLRKILSDWEPGN